ncbi:glycosyltransferase [Roseicella aquatilis]|uniref:Glycosyltransferase n=1 Tax=Roseicella aquatilis TaxID=2527868 RepID=A0A4R4DT67_9PROT|nr:glycosyltransferase [Roseicella aquatilis]TCZ65896.1 glycosyltransferase [Roseicella aquatilis]
MLLHLMGSASDGGAETYFLHLAEAFRQAGIPQAVALRAHAGRERALAAMGIPYTVLPFRRIDLTTRLRVGAYARRMGARTLLAWMSRSAANMPGGDWKRIGRLGGYYAMRFFRGCDLLVANTPDIRDYILRHGWAPERVQYIANFAEADSLPALPRAALDTPEGVPLLLSMGRLHREKGHDVTLRALAQLPEAVLWLAGSGPEEAALRALARELGVADRVRFLGWREDAGALYRAADLVVFPSREEPLGNVVIQAWVHGVPVISSRAIGPAHLIRDGEDGLLVPIEDNEALAAGIRRLLGDAALRAGLRQAGARRAPEFDRDTVVARWREILDL